MKMVCPWCRTDAHVILNMIEWESQSTEPHDLDNRAALFEHQCSDSKGGCGRSFWTAISDSDDCAGASLKPQMDVNVHESPSGTWIVHTDELVDDRHEHENLVGEYESRIDAIRAAEAIATHLKQEAEVVVIYVDSIEHMRLRA